MAHSLNSPSSFARRRACPGSARMEKFLPDSSSVYAAEGTAAHELGERCLKHNHEPEQYAGMEMGSFTHPDGRVEQFLVDGDMIDAVGVYVDYCKPLITGQHTMVEKKVSLPFIGDGESGTADFISISGDTLHVVDYKHGRGVPVEAYQNIQGLCYGLGAANHLESYDWKYLEVTIVQPRSFHVDGPIRSWRVDRKELIDWKMDIAHAAESTRDDFAPLHAGSHCRFCKARTRCHEFINFVEKATKMSIEDPNGVPINPDMLTDEEIVDLLFNKIPMIERWCADIKDMAQKRGEEKNPIPGTKLVKTRERMSWVNQEEAERYFARFEGAYKRTFLTAPQMKKLLGKKEFEKYESQYTHKVSTGVTVVPEDDPRPSARPSGTDEFSNVKLFG